MKTALDLFGRVLIPMLTPFGENGEINHEKTVELVNFLVENEYCDSLIIAGTNGEFFTLTEDERISLFETVKKATGDEIPIIAGTGANSTQQAILFSRKAEELDYDGVMILPPYYGKPTKEEVLNYYENIAEEIELPIIIYNIPIFTGVNVAPTTTQELSQIDNIVAIKEEAGINPVQCSDVLSNVPKDFTVYSGDDVMTLQIMIQGGSGVVSGGSHVVGDLMREQIDVFLEGNVDRSKELYTKTFRFFNALAQGDRINPVPLTKEALKLCGMDVGNPRQPLQSATERERKTLEKILFNLNKI